MAQVFSCDFWEISKNIFFTEHLWATASKYWKVLTLLRSTLGCDGFSKYEAKSKKRGFLCCQY